MKRLEGCTFKCSGCVAYSTIEDRCIDYVERPLPAKPSGLFSKDDLFDLHKRTTEHCLEVMKVKNHDYTSGGSVFANFKDSSILGVNPVLGILIRSIDKFKRIQTFVTLGELAVEGEGVMDAFDDVINYMILAKGIILEEQRQATVAPVTYPAGPSGKQNVNNY